MSADTSGLAALITLALGLLGFLSPEHAARLTGLARPEGDARPEMRATYGGIFIGLALACLLHPSAASALIAGSAWLGAASCRLASLALDRIVSKRTLGGLVLEAGLAVLFLNDGLRGPTGSA